MDEIDFQSIRARLFEKTPVSSRTAYAVTTYETEIKLKKFIKFISERNIIVKGKLQGYYDATVFTCMDCKYTWEETPETCIKNGCIGCKEEKKNLQKDMKLWEKSMAIVESKAGKIVKYSENDKDAAPTINDKFLVECRNGHTFYTSHKALRKNRWCKFCKRINPATESVGIYSAPVYKKELTTSDKQKQLFEICLIKGCKIKRIIDIDTDPDIKYELMCVKCGRSFKKTRRQILANVFLCPKKCKRSQKIIVSDINFLL